MSDDEILARWHDAELAYGSARGDKVLAAYTAAVMAENAAIRRFGCGAHDEAYRARFPDDAEIGC
ncbi:hypothetical protein [Sphingomonas abietis]|uniref:Uncharacterized protein n=1 Tax=Sphingomonas abietis TaxID=3012344 RepID=A0ABY7NSI3_9SPHN|nr:hypothetical protein [Sphingomonas abietis]WBO24473.1 hypothetical protein PBT88_10400 [Sphingomonas abietis]